MKDKSMNRKEFLTGVGKVCACSCVYALASGLNSVYGQDSPKKDDVKPEAKPEGEPVKKARSQERIEFTEKWAVRFFNVLDTAVDEPTRKKLMMANGRACLLAWQKETNQPQRKEPVTLEKFAAWVKEKGSKQYQVDGNVIYFQYLEAAETGLPSKQDECLCPMVETKPAGLSPTYCYCSLGYVKEMHEQMFQRPVEVELVSAVLRGDQRCKFKITVG